MRRAAALRCNRCGRPLCDQKVYYLAKAEFISQPCEVSFSEAELAGDHSAEISALLERMAKRPVEELEDEVFVQLEYFLCRPCKERCVREVRRGPRA